MKNAFTLDRPLGMVLILVISLAGFTGYCFALVNWWRDVSYGVYSENVWEGTYETGALLLYSVGALRFMNRQMTK